MKLKLLLTLVVSCQVLACQLAQAQPKRGEIVHDAEHYILLEENAEQ